MASRGKDIFMMPEEFVAWVRELTGPPLSEHLVLRKFFRKELIHWDGTDEALLAVNQVQFTGERCDLTGITSSNYVPGQLGWVSWDVPRVEGNILYSADLAAKSDWWDSDLQMSLEKKDALLRYDRIWRRLKPRLSTLMGVRNIRWGGSGPVTGCAYSPGAEAWYRRGGLLRQKGTLNNEYYIPDSPEVEAPPKPKRAASSKKDAH